MAKYLIHVKFNLMVSAFFVSLLSIFRRYPTSATIKCGRPVQPLAQISHTKIGSAATTVVTSTNQPS